MSKQIHCNPRQPAVESHVETKPQLHPRSMHREPYDFSVLKACCPELAPFIIKNKSGNETIDFFDPMAVKALNKSLLLQYYGLTYWEIPNGYLCPPVPGRADYIHTMADLLAGKNENKIPIGPNIRCLDIGTGANFIYPIIGIHAYGWSFTATDTDRQALASAGKIISQNAFLKSKAELILQPDKSQIFKGIIKNGERFDLTVCNPPFHASMAEARAGTIRKLSNLKKKTENTPLLNFGGQNNELWCPGGEERFVRRMVVESKAFNDSSFWFSTLVSKESHLKSIYKILFSVQATEVKTIAMNQGNKTSRVVAWTFLDLTKQQHWRKTRWTSI